MRRHGFRFLLECLLSQIGQSRGKGSNILSVFALLRPGPPVWDDRKVLFSDYVAAPIPSKPAKVH